MITKRTTQEISKYFKVESSKVSDQFFFCLSIEDKTDERKTDFISILTSTAWNWPRFSTHSDVPVNIVLHQIWVNALLTRLNSMIQPKCVRSPWIFRHVSSEMKEKHVLIIWQLFRSCSICPKWCHHLFEYDAIRLGKNFGKSSKETSKTSSSSFIFLSSLLILQNFLGLRFLFPVYYIREVELNLTKSTSTQTINHRKSFR